jgi:hypothetical protein
MLPKSPISPQAATELLTPFLRDGENVVDAAPGTLMPQSRSSDGPGHGYVFLTDLRLIHWQAGDQKPGFWIFFEAIGTVRIDDTPMADDHRMADVTAKTGQVRTLAVSARTVTDSPPRPGPPERDQQRDPLEDNRPGRPASPGSTRSRRRPNRSHSPG